MVIEAERKRQIFLDCHFSHLGHHLGQKKTVRRIQRTYYWLGIVRDVVDWVRSPSSRLWSLLGSGLAEPSCLSFQIKVCESCRHAERNKSLARTIRPLKVEAPWEIVGIDFIGTLLSALGCAPGCGPSSSLSPQGRFLRAGRATPASPFSLTTSANGPKPSRYRGQMLSRSPDVFPNAFTGEE